MYNRLKADINENKCYPKRIHQIVGDAMYINIDKTLPPDIDGSNLPEEFINQFQNKIEKIRNDLDEEDKQWKNCREEKSLFNTELNNYKELTQESVKQLIFKLSNKLCELYLIPTWMIKECIDKVLPLLTKIINLSLSLGEMPKDLKLGTIKPLLKKLGLPRKTGRENCSPANCWPSWSKQSYGYPSVSI